MVWNTSLRVSLILGNIYFHWYRGLSSKSDAYGCSQKAGGPAPQIRSYEAECLLRNGRLPSNLPDLESNQWSTEPFADADADHPPNSSSFTLLLTSTSTLPLLLLAYITALYIIRDYSWTCICVTTGLVFVFYTKHVKAHCQNPWCAMVVQIGVSTIILITFYYLFQSNRYRITSASVISAISHRAFGIVTEEVLKRNGYDKGDTNWIGSIIFTALKRGADEHYSTRDSYRMNLVLDKTRFLFL
ncbi:hypothetical protein GALMADRAFT_253313, partial [Galerina marginata CBS 339.88]